MLDVGYDQMFGVSKSELEASLASAIRALRFYREDNARQMVVNSMLSDVQHRLETADAETIRKQLNIIKYINENLC